MFEVMRQLQLSLCRLEMHPQKVHGVTIVFHEMTNEHSEM